MRSHMLRFIALAALAASTPATVHASYPFSCEKVDWSDVNQFYPSGASKNGRGPGAQAYGTMFPATSQRNGASVGCACEGGGGAGGNDGPGKGDGGAKRPHTGMDARVDGFLGAYHPVFGADLRLQDAGFQWFAGVSYNGRQEIDGAHYNSTGSQGNNWMQDSAPQMHRTVVGTDTFLVLQYGAGQRLLFRHMVDGSGNTYAGIGGTTGAVITEFYDPDLLALSDEIELLTYYDTQGNQFTFFGFEGGGNTLETEGRLWKVVDSSGMPGANVSYVGDPTDPVLAASSYAIDGGTDPLGPTVAYSPNYRYEYTYSSSAIGASKRLIKVEAFEGVSTLRGKVEYDYYTSTVSGKGTAGDLKTITVTTPLSDPGETLVETRYFRYYTGAYSESLGSENPGAAHMLKLVLDFEGVRRYGSGYESATDAQLTAYSSAFIKYKEFDPTDGTGSSPAKDLMVHKLITNGECGCGSSGVSGERVYNYELNANYVPYTPGSTYPWGGIYSWTGSEWYARTTVAQPDGSYEVTYFDLWGHKMASVICEGDPNATPQPTCWVTKYTRDTSGNIYRTYTPAAVEAYYHNDVSTPTVELAGTITVRANAGLVYHTSHDPHFAIGHLRQVQVSEGWNGSLTLVRETTYAQEENKNFRPVGDVYLMRPLVAAQYLYTGGSPETTSYTYDFYPDGGSGHTWQVKSVTKSPLGVPTSQNGDNGNGPTEISYVRQDGTVAFQKGKDDQYTYFEFDAQQRLVKTVRDAGTGTYADDPDDWCFDHDLNPGTPDWCVSDGLAANAAALNLETVYTYDPQGRLETTTLPNGRVTLSHLTKLADGRMVNLTVPRYEASPLKYYGPVSVSVTNQAGKSEVGASLAVADAGTTTTSIDGWVSTGQSDIIAAISGGLGGTSKLWRVGVNVFDELGTRRIKTRLYHSFTAGSGVSTLTGTSNIGNDADNFDETVYVYDDIGRLARLTDPTGTVDASVYDKRGRLVSRWVGTNATSATFTDPTGGGGGGNNMLKTETRVYDGGGVGNGYLTSHKHHVNSVFGQDRTTVYTVDYRGRTIVTTAPMAPHTVVQYDEQNRAIAKATYKTTSGLSLSTDPSATASNRASYDTYAYDVQGRVFETRSYEINQSTGAVNQDFSSDRYSFTKNWFSPSGDLVQQQGENVQKFAYDRLHRPTHVFTIAEPDLSYADVFDAGATVLDGDIVLKELQTRYEETSGNVLMTVAIDRHHNDINAELPGSTGQTEGPLDADASPLTPLEIEAADLKGRAQITAYWYDALDRRVTTAVYGTYGGFDFDRTATSEPTTSTSNHIVTVTTYDAAGMNTANTDANGVISTTVHDLAGRAVRTIANDDGSPGVDTSAIGYAYSKGRKTQMWVDMDHSGGAPNTGDQVTRYFYGVTTSGGSALASNRLLSHVAYPDNTTSTPTTDIAKFFYNRLGETIGTEDQAGIDTAITRDYLGRETYREFTNIPLGYDDTAFGIGTEYDARGLVTTKTQYSLAHPTSETAYTYTPAGLVATISQNSDPTNGGWSAHVTTFSYELTATSVLAAPRSAYRLTQIEYPDTTRVKYVYATGNFDSALNRVTRVDLDNADLLSRMDVPIATYRYNGDDKLITSILPAAGGGAPVGVASSLDARADDVIRSYANMDRFNRVTTSEWSLDSTNTSTPYYRVDVSYDAMSNVTAVADFVFPRWSTDGVTYDGMNRLTGIAIPEQHTEEFAMDRVGAFTLHALNHATEVYDWPGIYDERTHNLANELTERSILNRGAPEPVHDEVGNMTSDDTVGSGDGLRYTYDALGRMTKITDNPSVGSPAVIAEYRYDANNQRVGWRYPQRDDVWHEPVYDHRWRMIAVYRDESSILDISSQPGAAQALRERFYYHNAGVAGNGGSSYIDTVIRRDRDTQAPHALGPLSETVYYHQNWRGDVVCLTRPGGFIAEHIRYTAYGRSFIIPGWDWDGDGDLSDFDPEGWKSICQETGWDPGQFGRYRTDLNFDGESDYSSFDGEVSEFEANWLADDPNADMAGGYDRMTITGGTDGFDWGNRKGYSGYEHDDVVVKLYHVRNRLLDVTTAGWMSRDPIGYHDGPNLYAYVQDNPISGNDPFGLLNSLTDPRTGIHGLIATMEIAGYTTAQIIRALLAMGWSAKAIAAALGLTEASVIAVGTSTVTVTATAGGTACAAKITTVLLPIILLPDLLRRPPIDAEPPIDRKKPNWICSIKARNWAVGTPCDGQIFEAGGATKEEAEEAARAACYAAGCHKPGKGGGDCGHVWCRKSP